MTNRADYLALGDWNAVCYQCGRKRKASTLVKNWQGFYNCPEHNEARQPQDFVRNIKDNMTAPWAQPMPAPVFLDEFCTNHIAIPEEAVPDCAIPNTEPIP
jgi:hypothetical protein